MMPHTKLGEKPLKLEQMRDKVDPKCRVFQLRYPTFSVPPAFHLGTRSAVSYLNMHFACFLVTNSIGMEAVLVILVRAPVME